MLVVDFSKVGFAETSNPGSCTMGTARCTCTFAEQANVSPASSFTTSGGHSGEARAELQHGMLKSMPVPLCVVCKGAYDPEPEATAV